MAGYAPSPALTNLLGQIIQNNQPQQSQSPMNVLPGDPASLPVNTNLSGTDAGQRVATHQQLVNGPFGTHGVVGDILGHVMDAVLVNAGLHPEYAPRVQAAKVADALQNYDTDPLGAISNLQSIDPVQAQNMRNDLITNLYKQQLARTSAVTQQKETAEIPGIVADARQKAFMPYAQLAQAATANSWPAVRQRIVAGMTRDGLTDKLADLPQDYDAAGIAAFSNSAVPVDKQIDNAREAASAAETARHNKADEGLRSQSNSIEAQNAGTAATRAAIEAGSAGDRKRNIDSEIANRLYYQQHPELGRTIGGIMAAGGAGVPGGIAGLPPPRRAGDTLHGSDGSTFVSADGKTWTKK